MTIVRPRLDHGPVWKDELRGHGLDRGRRLLARLAGKPSPERAERRIEASSEAGIGGGITYDGVNYVGFMVPGGPNDSTPASLAHPGKGLMTGYSDAFAKGFAGKNGEAFIGVAYIGFNREPSSGNPSGISSPCTGT